MHDVLTDINHWIAQNQPVILATVANTWGSSPRGIGAKMAFTASGQITGSVSGGCVEGAVIEAGLQILESGRLQMLQYGVADETAFQVGLACGGQIEIFVQPLDPTTFQTIKTAMDALQGLAVVTLIEAPEELLGRQLLIFDDGQFDGGISTELDVTIQSAAQGILREGQSKTISLPTKEAGEIRLFVDVILPPPTLVMVGGVQISIALASIAKTLGYRTIIVDPRKAFATQARFPEVDQLLQLWPQEAFQQIPLTRSTAVVMLTHDPKIDDPALTIVLERPVFYIGALGSRKTQQARRQRLEAAGLSPTLLERIHGPVGINLGAKNPEEIALSVMAEIVAVARGAQA